MEEEELKELKELKKKNGDELKEFWAKEKVMYKGMF